MAVVFTAGVYDTHSQCSKDGLADMTRSSLPPCLIILSGLPGSGKTTLSKGLAEASRFVPIRIDVIEQAMREAGVEVMDGKGYAVGQAIAASLLRQGFGVIADSVNPIALTRAAWRDVGLSIGVPFIDVHVVCTDAAMHRERLETRADDIKGLKPVTWAEVEARVFEPWTGPHVVIDTAGHTVSACVEQVLAAACQGWPVPPP